jgi:ubiquinone/menaquinone biosynthesis C-methylase UbiE
MQILTPVRTVARRILSPRMIVRLRRYLRMTLPNADAYCVSLARKRGIEIGGPSTAFADEGWLPVYQVLESLDNCLYSVETIWTGSVHGGQTFAFHPRKAPGNQIICEACDLKPVGNASYECVLASHSLEHVANPLRALREWKRILNPEGLLLLILPHKDGTFDWRRPTTSLAHMISDYQNNVGEEDLTHLPEILELHDLDRDKAAGSKEQFRLRCLDNASTRAIHHHVFDTHTAVALLNEAAFQVVRVDTFKPYHIVVLAKSCDRQPDNKQFLGPGAEYKQGSPFPSDKAKR